MGKKRVVVPPRAVGGHALNSVTMAESSIVPAPSPPVIQAERVGAGLLDMAMLKPFEVMREEQAPTTVRGLSGIHPRSSPSLQVESQHLQGQAWVGDNTLVVPCRVSETSEGARVSDLPGPVEPVLFREKRRSSVRL